VTDAARKKLCSCDNHAMTNTEEDEALIGRYARGDAAAFDQLYRRHELAVWRYLERNVCNQATSDDLLQEIWLALARNATSLESVTRFRTRLFTLAHDRMTESLRARAVKASQAAPASRPAVADDPANELARAIGQLPSEQREAYLLQIEGQLSLGDTAEITESTVDAVENRLNLARSRLHELLNEGQPSEIDQLYRRLSALDPSRPGEWVRRKVQAYATQQAAERAVRANAKAKESSSSEAPTPRATAIPDVEKPAANKPWLLPVTFGVIAAAALVGFLVLPRVMAPPNAPKPAISPAPVSQPDTATPAVEQAPAPLSSESASPAPPSTPLESPAPATPTSPPPVPQSPATTPVAQAPVARAPATQAPTTQAPAAQAPVARAPTTQAPATQAPVARHSPAPPAPVVASSSAGTPPAQSPTRTRVARQNAAAPQSAPIASARAETIAQAARPAPPADPAPAPSTDTQVASAPPLPAATPSAAQPAPTPAAAASSPPDELWIAAKSGDMSGLQAALTSNVDVNAFDPDGETALILAIQHNHVDIVRALLAHGANPNTADARGFTPLRAARARANLAILTALENNGRH
jgi:RNA polymerase sigma factor (sigma-70 family)